MLYVFDMDGVLFRMNDPLPFAAETIARLKYEGHSVYYLTNNSSKSRADYVTKLAGFGIETSEDCVMTSAFATGKLFQQRREIGKKVFVVGEVGLKTELSSVGMVVEEYDPNTEFDFVVAGWDRQFTYEKLSHAHFAIVAGAEFIATNRDATYPDAEGRTLPGSGAIVAAIETCSGVTPFTVGKPATFSLELILEISGYSPDETIVVGDRLDTDIAIANAANATSVLVLTGVSTADEATNAPEDWKPDFVIQDLSQIP